MSGLAAFSLLGNLASSGALSNFELEDLVVYEPTQYPSVGTDSVQPPLPVSVPTGAGGVTFDPKAPLFFGVPPFARQEAGRKGARVKDMFDVAKDQGWLEGGGFWRTTTECVALYVPVSSTSTLLIHFPLCNTERRCEENGTRCGRS